jgi:sterol desaturase/sphingolipid hydroxylase (fatty acid hydroxylase superfamily)
VDETKTGTRDRRGHWWPKAHAGIAPVFVLPPQPRAFLRWLPSYFLPWNVLFFASAAAFWWLLTPDPETMATLAPGWMLYILARNAVAVGLFYGALELRLYVRRRQEDRFKYNPAFPEDRENGSFWWKSQTRDNMARTLLFAVPVWTAWEILVLWAFASGLSPMSSWAAHPLWLAGIALVVPFIHHVHFYLVHRLLHVPALYRRIHAWHHKAVNPSPWSSLSMHPVELLLYFSGAGLHLLMASHPLLAIYHLHYAGFGAAIGHIGFHTIETGREKGIDTHAFTHYLHHKYFEVNYGEGLVPIDKWMGTWHDGSEEGERLIQDRRARRRKPPA